MNQNEWERIQRRIHGKYKKKRTSITTSSYKVYKSDIDLLNSRPLTNDQKETALLWICYFRKMNTTRLFNIPYEFTHKLIELPRGRQIQDYTPVTALLREKIFILATETKISEIDGEVETHYVFECQVPLEREEEPIFEGIYIEDAIDLYERIRDTRICEICGVEHKVSPHCQTMLCPVCYTRMRKLRRK